MTVAPPVPDFARQEIKFVAQAAHIDLVHHWLRMHPVGFRRPFPDRWVNNVYFDTHDYHAFMDKLGGVTRRDKARYRWYGASLLPDRGVLEIKRRRNMFGWKLSFPVVEPPVPPIDWRSFRRRLLEQLPPEARIWLDCFPLPVMINRYHRSYYQSADGRIRATVDTRLGVWDQRFKPFLNVERPADLPRSLVLELKFQRGYHDVAAEVLKDVPLRSSAHSKYALGVQAIGPS